MSTVNSKPIKLFIADFGDQHVITLVEHYRVVLERQDVDCTMVENEWTELKQGLYKKYVHTIKM